MAGRTRQDAEGQCAAICSVAHEKARFIPCHIPSLSCKAGRAILLKAHRGRVAVFHVNAHDRCRGADANAPGVVDIERIGARASFDGEGRPAAVDIIDRKLVLATVAGVIERDLPINGRKTSRSGGVLRFDAQVVLFQAQCVKSERFAIHAVKPDADGPVDDQIVKDHLIRQRAACHDDQACGCQCETTHLTFFQ